MVKTLFSSVLFLLFTASQATGYYVSTTATGSGDGSFGNPWQLQIALNDPAALQPGDTIWVMGGTYTGNFTNNINGNSSAPVIVRNYNNERVILDGTDQGTVLTVNGSYTWFWGIECMSSDPVRVSSQTGSAPSDIKRGTGMNVFGTNVKFINCILHDGSGGFGFWTPSTNSEIYGCIVYNNGWDAPDRGHGHGIYAQNNTGTKKLHDNIIFNGYSFGIHIYTEGGQINNFDIRRNICFNAGGNNSDGFTTNILVGGLQVAQNPIIKHNRTYFNPTGDGRNNFGYSAGTDNMILDSNYFAAPTTLSGASALKIESPTNETVTNNTFIGNLDNFSASTYPQNTYVSIPPTSGLDYFVTPNKYETGRANIAIYNWANASSVQVNVSGIGLNPGDQYELVNIMDYFTDITTGTYNGSGNITITMTGHTAVKPIGSSTSTPLLPFPTFGAFVFRKTGITSINNELKNTVQVSAYPNPFKEQCVLSILNVNSENYSVCVHNLLGEIVLVKNFENNTAVINKNGLTESIYLYTIHDKDGAIAATGRIVVE